MTLAIRVMASLLIKDGMMVKGEHFAADRVVGEPVAWARVMANVRSIDELVVLDVGRGPADPSILSRIADECFLPIIYGGGVYAVDDAVHMVRVCGAEAVVLKWERRDLLRPIAERLGSQAVVACLEVRQHDTVGVLVQMAEHMVSLGAGELLIQMRDLDGTMQGARRSPLIVLRNRLNIPIVYSGGVSGEVDFVHLARLGADGICAGALWQFTQMRPDNARLALREAGFSVRLTA